MDVTQEQKNRIKSARFRTRKALRATRMDENEITRILTETNWLKTTPSQVLKKHIPQARKKAPARKPQAKKRATKKEMVIPHNEIQEAADEDSEEQLPLWLVLSTLGAVCGVLFGVPLLIAKNSH